MSLCWTESLTRGILVEYLAPNEGVENEQLEILVNVENGKRRSEIGYHENGKFRFSAELNKLGKAHGKFISHYDNGQLKSEGVFKNGKHEGEWQEYYEDGSLKSIIMYKFGKYHGPVIEYLNLEDTGLEWAYTFHKGTYQCHFQIGLWKYYNKSGELLREYDFGEREFPTEKNGCRY